MYVELDSFTYKFQLSCDWILYESDLLCRQVYLFWLLCLFVHQFSFLSSVDGHEWCRHRFGGRSSSLAVVGRKTQWLATTNRCELVLQTHTTKEVQILQLMALIYWGEMLHVNMSTQWNSHVDHLGLHRISAVWHTVKIVFCICGYWLRTFSCQTNARAFLNLDGGRVFLYFHLIQTMTMFSNTPWMLAHFVHCEVSLHMKMSQVLLCLCTVKKCSSDQWQCCLLQPKNNSEWRRIDFFVCGCVKEILHSIFTKCTCSCFQDCSFTLEKQRGKEMKLACCGAIVFVHVFLVFLCGPTVEFTKTDTMVHIPYRGAVTRTRIPRQYSSGPMSSKCSLMFQACFGVFWLWIETAW